MKKITILDTYTCSENLGDKIIMESVISELYDIFPYCYFLFVPTHEYMTKNSYKLLNKSEYIFVGGTNLLSSKMNEYNQWKIGFSDLFNIKGIILMGVGWWQYQGMPNIYTKFLLKRVLHQQTLHSVRDNYTENQLRKIGINNVVNTGCPTMWDLTEDKCKQIPTEKSTEVLLTLTDYKPDLKKDNILYNILKQNYSKIYFWIQGSRDYEYSKNFFNKNDVEILLPKLDELDDLLSSSHSLDYVGTRLHAGIRAIQHNRRSIIIGVDNRGKENAIDFNLNVIMRNRIEDLNTIICQKIDTRIKLPFENIRKWKDQFNGNDAF